MKPVPPRMSTRMAQSYRGWSVHQPTWRRHSCLPCRRLVSTLLADVTPCPTKSVPMSGDAAGRSACATDYPIDASEKCGLMPRLVAGGFVAADDEVGETEPCVFGAFQFAVERDVLGFLHAHARIGQEVEAVVGEIGDLFFGPLLGVGEVGFEVLDHGGQGGAVLGPRAPQVHAADLGDAARGGEGFQVEGGIPQASRARLLAGGAAIGLDLVREDVVAVVAEGGLLLGVVFHEGGDGGSLGGPPGGVIVAGALLVLSVVAGGEPV